MKNIINERKQNWLDLYKGKRQIAYMISPKKQLGEIIQEKPNLWLFEKEHIDATIEWSKKYYQAQMDLIEKVSDDRIPYLYVPTGTEIFAQLFGCKVVYPKDNNPFATPLISDIEDAKTIRIPDIGDEPLATILNMMDKLYDWAGKDAIPKLIDVQTPMDIVALIVEKTEFFMAMIENSDVIFDLSEKVKIVLFKFFDEWFRRYGDEYIAHFPDYFMKGGLTVSEDEIGTVSVDFFEKYFLNELNEISDYYGGIGIHCCADAMHQWGNFAKIRNLRLLNLSQPSNSIISSAYDYFENITAQFHNTQGKGEADAWYTKRPKNARCVYNIEVADIEEAKKVSDEIRQLF